ncbi:DUF917 domain-containing protein [Streptomyces pluripotens]|uniref:DUF917 domain-containing protein n=1 Tax=Streptomyces pluripotens TaxID=1355015 RepID=A0A221NWR4_9ACTN|nr:MULTISPECIES: DUF917 domain-containing protein [Streptomyces]ARP70081.1 hypothetical protein LK06_008990 [Streptomyces pluripotens]ASN24342.1 DUF917 domain-containing protein [Streptomyces pluripotens]KIE25366.1 hypothetical protein LK08_20190 [Streptomyces sp. MUSC 125]MCH0561298.1 DUF917 domain-containing protein [Streptomyces sp. MUM 16J]
MSFELGIDDLNDLARGAAVLGTGGGGDPHVGRLMVENVMRSTGPITIVDIDEIDDDDFIVPIAQMGAPTVAVEKMPAGTEPVAALRAVERHLGRTATATIPVECGGINSMIPLLVACQTGLPVVDGDGMGRAFPELQMKTFAAYGVPGSPMALVGERGETIVVDTGSDDKRMEWLARGITMRLGGAALIAEFTMTGAQVRRTAIRRTLTLALRIGRTLREAREAHEPPVTALARTIAGTDYRHLRVLFTGKVTDVERRTDGGFAQGRATFASFESKSELRLTFRNEFLIGEVDGEVVCTVPDLICVLDADNCEPITTEGLAYGQRATVLGIGTPPVMRTPEALAAFGPQAFGFTESFQPVEERIPC